MKTNSTAPDDQGYRFPPESISHGIWLSFRFSLRFRAIEELLAQRGIIVTSETVRQWCLTFGQTSAHELQRRRPRCGDTWHLDEGSLKINEKTHSLWRAVDQDGNVWDILVQSRRNQHVAKHFFRKLLTGGQDVPHVIITDKLKSSGAATSAIFPAGEHRQHTGLNNRAENSHHPTRLREKNMRRFQSAKEAHRFLSAFGSISGYFHPCRHRWRASEYRAIVQDRFLVCNEITKGKQAAYPPFSPAASCFPASFFFLTQQSHSLR